MEKANLGGRHLVAWHWRIWRHLHHTACSAAHIFLTLDVSIVRVQKPESGPGTQSSSALDAPHSQSLSACRVINGEGTAIHCVVGPGLDALQILGHSPGVREGELRLCARSSGHALHRECIRRVLDGPDGLRTR